MFDPEETAISQRAEITELLRSIDKRLQGVEGVEQPLVSEAAERSERQGDAEQRSVESRAVSPGEAEAALKKLLGVAHREAAEWIETYEQDIKHGMPSARGYSGGRADSAECWVKRITEALLPKPDIDAVEPNEHE